MIENTSELPVDGSDSEFYYANRPFSSDETTKMFDKSESINFSFRIDRTALFAKFIASDRHIFNTMRGFQETWELQGDQLAIFRLGYTLAYELFAGQANIDPKKPLLLTNRKITNEYFTKLQNFGPDHKTFLDEQEQMLEKRDKPFIKAIQDYADKLYEYGQLDEDGTQALLLGSVAMYDIYRYQARQLHTQETMRRLLSQ